MRVPVTTTKYPYSPTATKKDLTGTALIAVGIPTLFLGIGIVLIIIGIIMKARAKDIAEKESFGNWIASLEAQGLLNNISEDTSVALKVYKAHPEQETLDYLRRVNPAAAKMVDPGYHGKCELCGRDNVHVVNAKIVDEMGIRYRQVCDECFNKNKGGITDRSARIERSDRTLNHSDNEERPKTVNTGNDFRITDTSLRFANSIKYSSEGIHGDQIEIVKENNSFYAFAWNDGYPNKMAAGDYGKHRIPDSLVANFRAGEFDKWMKDTFWNVSICKVCPKQEVQRFLTDNKRAEADGSESAELHKQEQTKTFVCPKCLRELPLKYLYHGVCSDCFEIKEHEPQVKSATFICQGCKKELPTQDLYKNCLCKNCWLQQNPLQTTEMAEAVKRVTDVSSADLKQLAAAKDSRSAVTEKELIQYFAEFFAPNKEFYSTPGSEKYKAYFGVINAARNEMFNNPDIFSKATKWDISRLVEMLNNPMPGITNMMVCGLIFRTGDYGVLKSAAYCVDFCDRIPNCISVYLFLTAHKLPEDQRQQIIDAGDKSDIGAFRNVMKSLQVLDPKWSFTIL